MSRRKLDMNAEKELSKFLDEYLYERLKNIKYKLTKEKKIKSRNSKELI